MDCADGLRERLEAVYAEYNRPDMVPPDPLQLVLPFEDLPDREMAALLASSLAYGRVASMLRAISGVLELLEGTPSRTAARLGRGGLEERLAGFRYRFATGRELAAVLAAASELQSESGSLGAAMAERVEAEGYRAGLDRFAADLLDLAGLPRSHLLPRPSLGSACKRLNLMMRWMVRSDDVDPGGWEGIEPSELLVPLDVHMQRAGRMLGFTRRSDGSWRTAEEITAGFARLRPDDPTRYDFALTRFGIRRELAFEDLVRACGQLDRKDALS